MTTQITPDFDEYVEGLKRFMSSRPEFEDYNFDGSALAFLTKLLAYDSTNQSYTNTMLFNELHMTAEQRENLGSNSSFLSYVPRSTVAASFKNVEIEVTPTTLQGAPNTIVLDRTARFTSQAADGTALSFAPDKDYTLTLTDGVYKGDNIRLIQGIWKAVAFPVRGSGVQTYEILSKTIDIDTLRVEVQTSSTDTVRTPYNRFKSPFDLGYKNPIFFPQLNRKGNYEVEFGDGSLSKALVDGNIVYASYLETNGAVGNDVGRLTPASSVGGHYSIKLKLTGRSAGGAVAESTESIRINAPKAMWAEGGAVGNDQYAEVAKAQRPQLVKDAISWGGEDNVPKKPGTVFVSVVPFSGDNLSKNQKMDIQRVLKTRRVGSIVPVVVDVSRIFINVTTTVKYDSTVTLLNTESMRNKVKLDIQKFSKDNLEKFNTGYDHSTLTTFINNTEVAVKSNLTDVTYERRFVPVLNFNGTYQLEFHRKIAPGFKIGGFRMLGSKDTDVHEIYDEDGKLFIRRIRSKNNVEPLGQVGYVNYSTGLVYIAGFNPSAITGDYLKVEVQSGDYSRDIPKVKREYISINNVVVNIGE